MRRSRQFLSLPVISLEEGKEIGQVRGLVINHQKTEVAALLVQRGNFFREQKVIPYPQVVSVGNNALTIQKASSAERLTSLPQILTLVKDNVQLKGSRVITESGTALGHVAEYMVDTETGKIRAFQISGNPAESLWKGKALLSAEDVRTIGADVLVVRGGVEETLIRDESKLAGGVKSIKNTTEHLVKKARKLRNKADDEEVLEIIPVEEDVEAEEEKDDEEEKEYSDKDGELT